MNSPNPAFSHVEVPLASTFILSSKEGKEAYVQPVVGKDGYTFTVKVGKPSPETKLGTRAGKAQDFVCLMKQDGRRCAITSAREGKANCLGTRLMAIVAEGNRGRVYLDPFQVHTEAALSASDSEAVAWRGKRSWSGHTNTGYDHGRGLFCVWFGDLGASFHTKAISSSDHIQRSGR